MGNTVASSFLRANLPRKRKTLSRDYASDDFDMNSDMHAPKRRKVMSTSKYIYTSLFEGGQGSDIKISALNREWNLHKIYLSQSPYFNSMFNGTWRETKQTEITIGIEDSNITTDALHKVFGTLYQDEIQIESSDAVAILSCATLLQLDDLIHQSLEVMKDSINMETVLSYYEASELYGLKDVKAACLEWLYKNMAVKMSESTEHLRQISCDLMAELLSSPELIVVQTEFSLYLILKQWLFLSENPLWRGCPTECMGASQNYFQDHADANMTYLSTSSGQPYQAAFRALRLKHLIVHHVDMEVVETDHIIPVEWFMPIFKLQWYQMLRVEQGVDKGPKKVTEREFEEQCVRCGRLLNSNSQHSWRWTGFNFGFDLVVYYINGSFKFRRFSKTDDCSSLPSQRHLMYRLSVYSLDKDGRVTHQAKSKIQTVSLTENELITVLNLHSEFPFPLLLSANFLLTTPLRSTDCIMPASNTLTTDQ